MECLWSVYENIIKGVGVFKKFPLYYNSFLLILSKHAY